MPNATFLYTLAVGHSQTDKLSCFGEMYGFAPERQTGWHIVDEGFTRLAGPNFPIVLWGRFGLTDNAPDYFAPAGFSLGI